MKKYLAVMIVLLVVVVGLGQKVPRPSVKTTKASMTGPLHVQVNVVQFIASGSAALRTAAIAPNSCALVVSVPASGVQTNDTINTSFRGDPTSTAGYIGANLLTIYPYAIPNNVEFKVCNWSPVTVTPSPLTLNWMVTR